MAVDDVAPVQMMRLSAAEDAEVKDGVKVGGALTHARLCALNNTEREAVQGRNVHTCPEDAEDSMDEGYEARFVCHWALLKQPFDKAIASFYPIDGVSGLPMLDNEIPEYTKSHVIKRFNEPAVVCARCPYDRIGGQPTDATMRKQIQKAARSRRQNWPHSKKWAEKKVLSPFSGRKAMPTLQNPAVESAAAVFADIDDLKSKRVPCFHINSNPPGVIMRYATRLCIATNHPHLPGNAIQLAHHMRRTVDMLPQHLRYNEFAVVSVI
eukprot:jgi/Tetstr1/424007/TSEL_014618.t1